MRFSRLIFFSILLIGCAAKQKPKAKKAASIATQEEEQQTIQDEQETFQIEEYIPDPSFVKRTVVYPNLRRLPFKKDTNEFISYLVESFMPDFNSMFDIRSLEDKISACKKVKIFGSNESFSFIEYDYLEGASCAFPWKYQLIINSKGKLIKRLDCLSYTFVKIFPNQNPFLVTVTSTSKGNGEHHIYRIQNDSLINIYEGDKGHPETYDCHSDQDLNSPSELKLKIKDLNKDGYNDLSFYGDYIYSSNNDINPRQKGNVKTAIELIFIYDKKSGKFLKKLD